MALRPESPVQTGDSGPSIQLAQLSSLCPTIHFVDAIVVRGSLPRSARQTSIVQDAHQNRFKSRTTVIQTKPPTGTKNLSSHPKRSLTARLLWMQELCWE